MATIVKPLNGSQGIAFPRQTLQAGPGKGVGVTIPVDNYTDITFFIEYTRAVAGGGVQFNVEASNDKLNWYMVCETQSPAIVPGADVTLSTQRAIVSYIAVGASAERIISPTYTVMGHYMRISIGDAVGNPGVGQVEYFLKGAN